MGIVFIRGSARDSRTRTQRHHTFPRQTVVRIGPWVIRPARRTSVRLEQLKKHVDAVLENVKNGLVMIERPDMSIIGIEELRSLLGRIPGEPKAPEAPQVAPPPEPPQAEAAWGEDADTTDAEEVPGAPEPEVPEETPVAPETVPEETPVATPEEAPEIPEEVPEEVTATEEAPEASASELPEGWREFTNAKLQDLIKALGLPLPEKINKTSLIATLESHLEA